MPARLVEDLRSAPSAPLIVAGSGVLAWFALERGGQPVTVWAPGGLLLFGLLAVGLAVLRPSLRGVPRTTVLAGVLLAAYCAWSYASIGWADDRGAAWEGAARTLVYLGAFLLFGLWRQTRTTAAAVLAVVVTAATAATAVIVVRLAGTSDARELLPSGRLLDPTGYANATAALLLMATVVALCAAASPGVWWWLRGLAAGAVVLLVDGALLAVSRGSLIAFPLTLAVLLLAFPGRVRRAAVLLPAGLAILLAARSIIDLTDLLDAAQPPAGTAEAHRAARLMLLGAAGAAVVVAALALGERAASSGASRGVHRVSGIALGVAAALALVAAVVVVGSPRDELDRAWSSFKQGYGEGGEDGTRLASGLGSDRYLFYRVALDRFEAHPIAGIGADNFFEDYLRDGSGGETPHYPHSLELRTLSQTGIVGALLLFGAFAAAAPGAIRAARRRGPHAPVGALAAGATTAVVYWLIHGSADWFFEYAGLGTIAFALLGLATALDPARTGVEAPAPARRVTTLLAAAGVALAGLVLLGSVWASALQLQLAGQEAGRHPGRALGRLERARQLDPYSARPDDLAGTIAVRSGDLARADRAFRRAVSRVPRDQYATVQLAAIASARGQQPSALRLADRAVALAPRDLTARDVRAVLRSGATIDVVALQRRFARTSELNG